MINKIMGAEQADGLIIQGNNPTPNGVPTSENEHMQNEMNNNVISTSENTNQTTTTQYYYERNEIKSTNIKKDEKENINEEPDSTTIFGKRVIQMNKPATIYEKRVISKTIKKESNINNNNIVKATPKKYIKIENISISENKEKDKNEKENNEKENIEKENIPKENIEKEDKEKENKEKEIKEMENKDKKNEEKENIINQNEPETKKEEIVKIEIVKKEIINENLNKNEINNPPDEFKYNKINTINNTIVKKNIITYTNPSVKIMHRNVIGNRNFRQKNILPRTNINNMNKSSNYFISGTNTNKQLVTNKSFENINFNSQNKLLSSTNNYLTNNLHLKKIDLPNLPGSQRPHSPDVNSIKRKTINRGDEIKNVQITHIICSNKNKDKSFHITEKLSTQNIKSTPLTITTQDREKLKKGGKSTYTSSCTEYKPIPTQNLKGKTTIYQHARGIGMTNDRRNNNSQYYTSEIKKLEPIVMKKKEKVEHVENFRSSKYRNCNTIENCSRGFNKKKIGNEDNKEKVIQINTENNENKDGNIIVQ